MSEPTSRTSPLLVAAAWLVVAIPLAWGVYETSMKAMPLFRAPTETPASAPSPTRP